MERVISIETLVWSLLWFTLLRMDYVKTQSLKPIEVDSSLSVTFPCSTDSPRVLWYYGERVVIVYNYGKVQKVNMDDRLSLMHEYDRERNLNIKGVKLSDAGRYSCRIPGPNRTSPALFLENYQLIISSEAAIYENSASGNIKASELSTVGLWCNATGHPVPDITWYVVEGDKEQTEHPLGVMGRYLEIRNVTRGCSSTYRCKASNRLNSEPDTHDMNVNVLHRPDISAISLEGSEENLDKFEYDEKTATFKMFYKIPELKKSDIRLICHVTGNPYVSIAWKVGNNTIGERIADKNIDKKTWDGSHLFYLYDTDKGFELQFTPTGDHDILFARQFSCVAKNSEGTDQCHVRFFKVA